MLISHDKRFIFIHNYKVAGSSIKKALSDYDNFSHGELSLFQRLLVKLGFHPNVFSNQFHWHVKAKELREEIPEHVFNNYFKFGFVRDPWDRQVSLYKYLLKTEDHFQHDIVKSMKNFDEYLKWRVNGNCNLQKEFFYDDDDNCLVDFIGKMEDLEKNFSKICNKIDIDTGLPHVNKSRPQGESYLSYYSQESIDLIYDEYQEDVKLFGYKKPVLKKEIQKN
ncbi:MAG: sulfotransferase family 2 domain-containing protein [Bacteroidetes bacterium]|nr:sulfotransferase family 2 domain-containing protein [Bacteroidota bacterium]